MELTGIVFDLEGAVERKVTVSNNTWVNTTEDFVELMVSLGQALGFDKEGILREMSAQLEKNDFYNQKS